MKVLLLGKNGQVGWELQRSLAPLGELVALDRHSTLEDGGCGDLNDLDGLRETVTRLRPDVIVNAAAHTAVDKAESEPELARALNAAAPGVLAEAAHAVGALLVHYSTDYVFDGSGTAPWTEDAATGPLSVYGQTKLEGEQLIAASGARHLIFRTSWVYAARGGNFAKTMLRLAQERERLTVIDDQFGAPTGAELIADVTAHAIRQTLRERRWLRHLPPGCRGRNHLERLRPLRAGDRARTQTRSGAEGAGRGARAHQRLPHPCPPAAEFAPGHRTPAQHLRSEPAPLATRRAAYACRNSVRQDA